jgi:hypothetical protein
LKMASEILSNDEEDSMDAMKSANAGEIEDGELPEEGEISDNDEDQRVTHARLLPPPPMGRRNTHMTRGRYGHTRTRGYTRCKSG